MNDGLTDKERTGIQSILTSCSKVQKVILFGSRAMGTFRAASDIDLALEGDELTLTDLLHLKSKIDELNLPVDVDLILMNSIENEELKKHIKNYGVSWIISDCIVPNNNSTPIINKQYTFAKNWEKTTLDKIMYILGGGTPKRNITEYWGGNIPWISISDFNNSSRYISKTKESITTLGLDKSNTTLLEEGQLILSARGTVGALAQTTRSMAFNQSCYGLNAHSFKASNDFLYYLIKHSIKSLKQKSHGSVFDTITRDTFSAIRVLLPSLPEQQKIAAILSSLDDKIELNNNINANLEAQAQALFKSWFVDFDPFQDGESVDSELGRIPKGWETGILSDIVEINPKTPLKGYYHGSFIEMKALPTQGYCITSVSNKKATSGSHFKNDDILFARITPCLENGKTGIVFTLNPNEIGIGSTEFLVLRGKGISLRSYIACLSRQTFFREYAQSHMNGSSGRQRVQASDLKKKPSVIPSEQDLIFFEKLTGPIFSKIGYNSKENIVLSGIRDTILPKLMAGELSLAQ